MSSPMVGSMILIRCSPDKDMSMAQDEVWKELGNGHVAHC